MSEQTGRGDKVRIGCISWTYPDWQGSFYPEGTRSADYLALYSKVFDIVEVDSTFYRLPSASLVKQWRDKTAPGFLFTVKVPQKISHQGRLKGVEEELERFEKTIVGLDQKLACAMLQLPPNSRFAKEYDNLEKFLDLVNPGIRYAIEFRDRSWLNEDTFALLSKKRACLTWSVTEKIDDISPRITSDFVYLRFMGKFGEFPRVNKIQKDRSELQQKWFGQVQSSLEKLRTAYVLVSNHFAGFAPSTVNQLRLLNGMQEVNWAKITADETHHSV